MLIKHFNTVVLLILTFTAVFSCKEEKKHSKVAPIAITFKQEGTLTILEKSSDSIITTLAIEIAEDQYETETGLMYRKSIKASQGMLFIFEDSQYRRFYMRNTEFPLDIIYIDENKTIINILKNTIPFDETALPSQAPAQYVLEVNAGLSDKWNIKSGDKISFTKL
jgi:hypothetical protein